MNKAIIYKIKNNDSAAWENWCKEISTTHIDEAHESLAEERVKQEMFVTFSIDSQLYGLAFLDGECKTPNQHRAFVHEHASKVEENLDPVGEGKVLYNLFNQLGHPTHF